MVERTLKEWTVKWEEIEVTAFEVAFEAVTDVVVEVVAMAMHCDYDYDSGFHWDPNT